MDVRPSTQAAPDRDVNEDGVLALEDLVAVFDGVTQPATIDSGCVHGPAWYVRRLSARLAMAYAKEPLTLLPELLARAIDGVAGEHYGTCDLTNPSTPAATVGMLRAGSGQVEYLVLCDSTLVLDQGDRITAITDDRIHEVVARLRGKTVTPFTAGKWQYINRPGGYWIAAADPEAAHQALTGTAPLTRRAALLTDGAAAAVVQFKLFDWNGLLDVLTTTGPADLITRIRTAEHATVLHDGRPRYKRHDDATAAICVFAESNR